MGSRFEARICPNQRPQYNGFGETRVQTWGTGTNAKSIKGVAVATLADLATKKIKKIKVLVSGVWNKVKGARSGNSKVKEVLDAIDENGYKVKINPKNSAKKQEVNAAVDFGDGTKVNLRVEAHPLKQNGPGVRHTNVEVTRQVKNKKRIVRNDHIVDE